MRPINHAQPEGICAWPAFFESFLHHTLRVPLRGLGFGFGRHGRAMVPRIEPAWFGTAEPVPRLAAQSPGRPFGEHAYDDGLLAGRPEFKLPGHIAGNPTDAVSLDEDGARVPLVIGIGTEDDAMRFHIPVPILSVLAGKGAGPIRIIRRRRGKQRVARRILFLHKPRVGDLPITPQQPSHLIHQPHRRCHLPWNYPT